MRFKRYVKNLFFRSFLHLKSIGVLAFIPLIVINVILPLLTYLVYRQYGKSSRLEISIQEYSQWLLPLACVWWPMFVMKEYIEGDGKELLYINKPCNKLLDLFLLFAVSTLNVSLIFLGYTFLIPYMKYEYLRIVVICFLYFSMVYAIGFTTNSSALTVLSVVLYTLTNIYYGRGQNKNIFIYLSTQRLTVKSFISNYVPLLVIGIVLIIFGIILNKKRRAFK